MNLRVIPRWPSFDRKEGVRSSMGSGAGDCLLNLIKRQRWKKVNKYLRNLTNHDDDCMKNQVGETRDTNGGNIFHILCRFQPPPSVIDSFTKVYPHLICDLDSDNRTPLHIASICGAGSEVIQQLVNLYPDAITVQDIEGDTPLIAACKYQALGKNTKDGKTPARTTAWNNRFSQVIYELVCVTPNGAHLTDKNGSSALEYALLGSVSDITITLLQRATAIETRITSELSDRQRRTQLPSFLGLSGEKIYDNDKSWDCINISPTFGERNYHRLKRGKRKLRRAPPPKMTFEEYENFHYGVMVFIGMGEFSYEDGLDCFYDKQRSDRGYCPNIPPVLNFPDDATVISDL